MSNTFWKSALIRAVKTLCQTAIATIGTAKMVGDVDWMIVASASFLAFVLSIMTSVVGGLPEVADEVNEK